MRFIIIVAMYNMERWIADNIQSLKNQTHSNFHCLIGDDLSTDNSVQMAQQAIRQDSRFTVLQHSQKKYSMGNIYSLIEQAQPDDNDVIVLIDGDDRLAHTGVLQRLATLYTQQGCWMTYGSYSSDGTTADAICYPYPAWIQRFNLFRLVKWRASHLKTFKYGLWKHIPDHFFTITEQELQRAKRRALLSGRWRMWWHWRNIELPALLDPAQQFARRCSDKNMTIPLLELAGTRAYFLDEIVYLYTTYDKDLHFDKKPNMHQKWFTRLIRDILWHKPALRPLKTL